MGYDGFISYSHGVDGRLAPALQRGLQRLAKPWNSRRALHIFRDETSLATNPHLWGSIEEALDDSEWFILLASPESAASEWVNREIRHWLTTRSIDRVLPVVTDGVWEWDPQARDFTAGSTAVAGALRGTLRDEPRHLDLRWARTETDLDLRNGRFRSAVADLAAPMHGIPKDELEGEDLRQHRRTRRLARAGVATLAVLLVVAVVVSIFAVAQRDRANENAADADHALLVSESQALLASNRQLATLLAIEADRRRPGADTRDALMHAVLAEPRLQRTFGGPVRDMAALSDGRVAILSAARDAAPGDVLQLWSWKTGRRARWRAAQPAGSRARPVAVAGSEDGRRLAILWSDGTVRLFSGGAPAPEGPPIASGLGRIGDDRAVLRFAPSGSELVAARFPRLGKARNREAPVRVVERSAGRWTAHALPSAPTATRAISFDLRAGMMASLATTGRVTTATVQDLRSGRPLATFPTVSALDLALDGRHRRVVVTPLPGGGSDAVVYSLDGASRPRPMDVDEKPGFGEVMVGFDGADERLAISSSTGVGLYDAATLLPVAGASGLPTGTLPGPFLFLDPDHVLTGTTRAGPLSVWSVRGTSALVTHEFPQFNKGVYPEIGGDGSRLVGISLSPSARSITMLDARFRPLTGPIAVEPNLQAQPADVRNALNTVGPVMCADPAARRLAIVSLTPPDLTIRNAAPPFQVLSHTAGAGRELGYPDTCVWSHDGHQIAIGTAPFSPTATPGVGLFDVRTHTMRRVDLPPAEVVSGLAYSPDSRTLWASGFNHVYRITDLDRRPRVGAAFPGGSGVVSTRDGSRLIVTTSSSVRVYDGRTLAPVTKSIPLGSSFLYQTNGSADGRTAVANSSDGWRLVDLKAEQPIGPWVPGPFPSLSIISADGNALYTVATSGEGQIWDVSRANLRAAACGMAGRNLTRAEWDRFLPRGGAYRATCAGYPTS